MQPFKATESGYTPTATTVLFTAETHYSPTVLDNPVRKKVNYATISANVRNYKRGMHAL